MTYSIYHTQPDYPMRRITERRYYTPQYASHGTGSVELTLDCGHKVRRKRSSEPRRQCRCQECYADCSAR